MINMIFYARKYIKVCRKNTSNYIIKTNSSQTESKNNTWNKNLKLHQKYSKYSLYFSWKSSVLCFRDFAGIYIIDL